MWQGAESMASIHNPDDNHQNVNVTVRKLYTPKAEIAQALQKSMADGTKGNGETVRPESVETFEIGGQQALRCVVDTSDGGRSITLYYVWIRTESTSVLISAARSSSEFSVFRWRFDPVLATVKVP
jgi:hypothetical protein